MTLEEFVARAGGVPFVAGGRDYDGWDCWGLCFCAYRDVLGKQLERHDGYQGLPDYEEIAAIVRGDLPGWDEVEAPEPLDVALYKVGVYPSHIALVVDKRRALHANEGSLTALARLSSPLWKDRLEGFYRYAA